VNKLKAALVAFTLILPVTAPSADAQEIGNCRISASDRQIVSLGFPLRPERLAKLSKPNVLVLPYVLADETPYPLTDQEKGIFLEAGKNIYGYSSGQNQINFRFSPAIKIEESTDDINALKRRQQTSWQSGDYEQSTYGFVSKVIKTSDSVVDYSGIDAVILFGNSTKRTEEIAEAMMYTNDPQFLSQAKRKQDGSPWFLPPKTSEEEIKNVILLYNRNESKVIAHELMHLYGLTDLYGSAASPRYSLMVDLTNSLLPFEKWILGWLPDSQVQCVSEQNEISSNLTKNRFSLNYAAGEQSLVVPTGSTSGLVVDVFKSEFGKTHLVFYSLENEDRPPIKCFFPAVSRCGEIVLDGFGGIGTQLSSPKYNLLISDNDGSNVTIHLVPNSQLLADDFNQLLQIAQNNFIQAREKVRDLQAAADKAAADKAAADKAAADKAAADKAAADKAAADKAAAKPVAKGKTIVCIKGKSSLKVIGKNPKCPAGYKMKK
jgi:hypothetical protein